MPPLLQRVLVIKVSRGEFTIFEDALERPLIGHARCLSASPGQVQTHLASFVSDPQVTALSNEPYASGGWLTSLAGDQVRVGFLGVGQPVTLRLWNDRCFACALPLRGRARLEQYPQALASCDGPFFLMPKSDQQWQLSADCELLVLRVYVEAGIADRIVELLTQSSHDCNGCIECARVMMESIPWRLHHGLKYSAKLQVLQRLRNAFLQLFGFPAEPQEGIDGPRNEDPRVRRAVHYILSLSPDEYDLDAICEQAHMSRRGIYYAFERTLGCTPYAYFLACHLTRVRLSLITDAECRQSIAWHAALQGFQHMGHFAARYREYFGELPSATREHLSIASPA